jgi:hypothetical protein
MSWVFAYKINKKYIILIFIKSKFKMCLSVDFVQKNISYLTITNQLFLRSQAKKISNHITFIQRPNIYEI